MRRWEEETREVLRGEGSDDPEPSLGSPHLTALQPHRRQENKVGRNDPCPCGSGKKYKKCCLDRGQGIIGGHEL